MTRTCYPRRKLKQEDWKLEAKQEFQARCGHVVRPCLQQQQKAEGTRRAEERGKEEEKEERVN